MSSDGYFDGDDGFDEEALGQLDAIEAAHFSPAKKLPSTNSKIERTKSTPRNPFGQQGPKTKKWDQTAFAKSGGSKGKGKAKARQADDEDAEDAMEFEQFPNPLPPPFVPSELQFIFLEHKSYPGLFQLGK